VEIDVPRDRAGTFEPQIVKKRQRRLNGVDEMVLSLYAKGLTTGEISAHFAEICGASAYWRSRSQGRRSARVVRADLTEVVSLLAADVLGDLQVTVQVEPLGDGGIPEGEVHVRPGLPRIGTRCHEAHKPLSPASPVDVLY
jgi:hypothetical protein